MSNTLSAKYYQEEKERLQKILAKDIKRYLSKEEKEKKAAIWSGKLQQYLRGLKTKAC